MPVRAVLVRSGSLVIVADHFVAYPSGFEVRVAIRMRQPYGHANPTMMYGGPLMGRPGPRAPGQVTDDRMRLGIAFADGRKATNLTGYPHFPAGASVTASSSSTRSTECGDGVDHVDEPEPPLLLARGGGGDGRRWDQTYWVWGLPPDGPVGVVVEWPAEAVTETRVDVDGAAIRQAGARAEILWPD